MLLDRHRISRLIALSTMASAPPGPERQLHEEALQLFLKAAYDDATDAARAAFMERVEASPASEWPWSAVRATPSLGGAGGGGGRLGFGGLALALPKLTLPATPPALLLLRGQAESADADPGDRLPERGSAAGAPWEPLHLALDRWDTQAILPWMGPQGWSMPSIRPVQADTSMDGGVDPIDGAASSGAAADPGGEAPAETPEKTPKEPGRAPTGGGQSDLPAPSAGAVSERFSWRHPVVVAAGTALVVGVGAVVLVRASHERSRRMISERLTASEGERS